MANIKLASLSPNNGKNAYNAVSCKHRRTTHGARGLQPPRIFQIAIFGQKLGNIREKPLDFRASNGRRKIFGQETSAPRTKLVPYAYGCKLRQKKLPNLSKLGGNFDGFTQFLETAIRKCDSIATTT